ncbi:hypothetical protein V6N13_104258 [Hibiscus sabdariffa]
MPRLSPNLMLPIPNLLAPRCSRFNPIFTSDADIDDPAGQTVDTSAPVKMPTQSTLPAVNDSNLARSESRVQVDIGDATSGMDNFLETLVYGSPSQGLCGDLLHHLQSLASHLSNSWVIIGDFNATLLHQDRRGPFPISGLFSLLEVASFTTLSSMPTKLEIRDALFSMAPLKALGIDGLHAHFYQHQWEFVGASLCKTVKSTFAEGYFDPSLNRSAIVLIPKIPRPETFTDFGL